MHSTARPNDWKTTCRYLHTFMSRENWDALSSARANAAPAWNPKGKGKGKGKDKGKGKGKGKGNDWQKSTSPGPKKMWCEAFLQGTCTRECPTKGGDCWFPHMSAAFVEQLKTKGAGKGKRKGSPAAKAKAKAKAAAVSQPLEAEAGPVLRVVAPAASVEVNKEEPLIDEEGFMKYGVRRIDRQRIRKSASPGAPAPSATE